MFWLTGARICGWWCLSFQWFFCYLGSQSLPYVGGWATIGGGGKGENDGLNGLLLGWSGAGD